MIIPYFETYTLMKIFIFVFREVFSIVFMYLGQMYVKSIIDTIYYWYLRISWMKNLKTVKERQSSIVKVIKIFYPWFDKANYKNSLPSWAHNTYVYDIWQNTNFELWFCNLSKILTCLYESDFICILLEWMW